MPRPFRPTLAVALLAAVLAPAGPAAAQQLSAVEQRIADHADAHVDEAVELLKRTVNINSGTLNPEGVRRVAADISFAAPYVDAALGGLGAYGSGSHSVEERLDLSSMPKATKRAAIFMYRLTRGAPGTE